MRFMARVKFSVFVGDCPATKNNFGNYSCPISEAQFFSGGAVCVAVMKSAEEVDCFFSICHRNHYSSDVVERHLHSWIKTTKASVVNVVRNLMGGQHTFHD